MGPGVPRRGVSARIRSELFVGATAHGVGACLLVLACVVGCGNAGGVMKRANAGLPQDRGFLVRSIDENGSPRRYSVYIPRHYTPSKKWPALVFLHGIGEGGNDGTKMLGVGLAPAILERTDDFPFIAIFPQTTGDWKGEAKARRVLAVLDDVQRDYAIDPDRVILTGLSTGGYGTWAIGADHKDRFAALVPMCAYAATDRAQKLADMPIWCFHNAGDWAVGSGNSRKMIDRIRRAGGNPKYTQYSGFSHDCWTKAYRDGDLYAWMLRQRRGAR